MRAVFVLGKPARRSPVIAEVIEDLGARGVTVDAVVPQVVADDGAWLVDGQVHRVDSRLGEAELVAQRGLGGEDVPVRRSGTRGPASGGSPTRRRTVLASR